MTDESCVKLRADRRDIAWLNRIIEGCGHVGVLSTLDKERGIVIVRSTPDMLPQLRLILQNLAFSVIFLD
jgi:putative protease